VKTVLAAEKKKDVNKYLKRRKQGAGGRMVNTGTIEGTDKKNSI